MSGAHGSESRSFADLLRRHRLAAGVTQEELAERAGLSSRGISDLERGARTHPHRETVRLLADALGLSGAARATFVRAAPHTTGRAAARTERAAAQFPVPLTPLIGRQRERAVLDALLRDGVVRLVALTGPGGVGKTRLALAVAEHLGDAFPDGRVFVDLAPLRDPALLVPHVAMALGVPETAGRALADVVHDFLREREMLLLLDNFEHLLPAAPVVTELLAAGPGVKVLATSRAPLRVRGEREYPVAPMDLPTEQEARDLTELAANEAVAFFVDRAQAAQPDFALTSDNASAVVDICRRLDGLPLALELAAARVKILPPLTLRARLGARLPLLTGGPRDAPERQRTLRDAIAWSHDLLTPEARVLFGRLAVFAGGFTLEAAEAVAAGPAPLAEESGRRGPADGASHSASVVDLVASLLDGSLVQRDERPPGDTAGDQRFRMLETIREFALEKLAASGAEPLVRQAHAMWFLALAEADETWTWGGSRQTWWLDRLEADLPNMRATLAWFAESDDTDAGARLAAAMWEFWHLRSLRAEGRAWLERALARGIASDRTRARVLLALGELHTMTGGQQGAPLLEQSLALSRRLSDTRLTAEVLFTLGTDERDRGDLGQAASLLVEAVTLASEIGHRQLAALARLQLGVAILYESGPERAEPLIEEALALHLQQDNTYGTACAQLILGWAAAMRRDTAPAAARYAESLALWEELGTQEGIVDVLAGAAELAAIIGDPERAARLFAAAESLGEAVGYVLPPLERARYDRTRVGLRAMLGGAALDAAWAGGLVIPAEQALAEVKTFLADILEAPNHDASPPSEAAGGLTPREREVLRLVVAGRSNPEIAAALFLSRRTVTTHLTSIYAKLGVAGRAEAAVLAVRRGLV